jgi:hypothetical protein
MRVNKLHSAAEEVAPMKVSLTLREVLSIALNAREGVLYGRLILDIPDDRIRREPLPLIFSGPRTVRCGEQSVVLSEAQFALLSYLHKHRKATFEELRKRVWGRPVSDAVIYCAGTRLFNILAKTGIAHASKRYVSTRLRQLELADYDC